MKTSVVRTSEHDEEHIKIIRRELKTTRAAGIRWAIELLAHDLDRKGEYHEKRF